MRQYLVQRLLLIPPTLVLVSIVIFFALRILPGNVAYLVLGIDPAGGALRPQDVEKVEKHLGLDRPIVVQYGEWMGQLARFDLGTTFYGGVEILDIVKRRGPVSMELAIGAVLLSWIWGLPSGVLSALKKDSVWDSGARVVSIVGLAVPQFWLGMLLLLGVINFLDWAPPAFYQAPWDDPITNIQQMILPTLVLGVSFGAYIARMARSTVLEVLREDYVRTARAKGLRERTVIGRHVLRNSLIPVITLSGVQLGALLGGSVVIETVFNLPGLGKTFIDALTSRDLPVVQTLVTLYALFFLAVNLLIDLSYVVLDPRVGEGR